MTKKELDVTESFRLTQLEDIIFFIAKLDVENLAIQLVILTALQQIEIVSKTNVCDRYF